MSTFNWDRVEEAVHRLFEELAHAQGGLTTAGSMASIQHTAIGPMLSQLGWASIEAEFPTEACELLFRAQGRSLAQTDCLSRVMLAELSRIVGDDVDGIVLPDTKFGETPKANPEVYGLVLGPLRGRLAVPVSGSLGTVSVGVVEASRLEGQRLDTFDPTSYWTTVRGSLDFPRREASTEWYRAVAAAQRGLATEIIALADSALRIVTEFHDDGGSRLGWSRDTTEAEIAQAAAHLEGARALIAESWRYGGRLSAITAKCAAGRIHRRVSELALRSMGIAVWTHESAVTRYAARGMQLDALFGSHEQLEAVLGEQLFEVYPVGRPLSEAFP